MNSKQQREISVQVSKDNIRDQVAALLYAMGVVKTNDDITELHFDMSLATDVIPVTFKYKTEREVKVVQT